MQTLWNKSDIYAEPVGLSPPDAELIYFPQFLPQTLADDLLNFWIHSIAWQALPIRIFGKEYMQPRLTAWYADAGVNYTYSGIRLQPESWTPELQNVKLEIEKVSGCIFNSVLLNYYRNGNDSMGWHADDEPELGKNPIIGSLTLGATRSFHLKHRSRKDVQPLKIHMAHGSLLIMAGTTQHHWLHQVPKCAKPVQGRINLTFRNIFS